MEHVLDSDQVYASEFYDGFTKIYGPNPDYTGGTSEAFQALESALKFHLGEDKGQNLGAILGWLKANSSKWTYVPASPGQDDAGEHFLGLINFVNKSYRKVKHGQPEAKLTVDAKQAETVLRAVALLIYELENTIEASTEGDE